MARERVIVKLALQKVREALKTIIKVSLYGRDSQLSDIIDMNLLSLALKYMNNTNKVPSLLEELESVLVNSQIENIDQIEGLPKCFNGKEELGCWSIEDKFEDPYLKYLYPTARALEALAPRDPHKRSIDQGINFLSHWVEEQGVKEMVQNKCKFAVPLMQAAVKVANNARGETKEKAEKLMKVTSDFPNEKQIQDDIYAQTIRYKYFIYNNHVLDKKEVQPLIDNINSGIFRKMMKGLEFLSALTFDLRQNSTNEILDMLPKFRKQIFNIMGEKRGAIYFASVSESMKNTLQDYQNKTFARSFFNLMVEESSWISQPIFHPVHICKILVGTSLLIFSRGALRR